MCEVIAEIGWNHMGDMALAERMVEEAAKAGATYAKFQSWSVKNLKPGPWDTDGRRQIYEQAQLTEEKHLFLIECCKKNGIEFLTSVFSEDAAVMVGQWCKTIKIPSTEIANTRLLAKVNELFDRVFLSTGAATSAEIGAAVQTLKDKDLTLLHCVSSYPCKFENVNLYRLDWLDMCFRERGGGPRDKKAWPKLGYSGHAEGIFDAIASLEMGVTLIEKHFTIDRNLPGRDNKFAILPDQLKTLCEYIKCREKMFLEPPGPALDFQECEREMRNVYRGRWERD